eukprot:6278297-Prymnesium_polylepis.2
MCANACAAAVRSGAGGRAHVALCGCVRVSRCVRGRCVRVDPLSRGRAFGSERVARVLRDAFGSCSTLQPQ